jgi:hypothetical protein
MDRPTKPSGRHAVRLRWDEIITRLSYRFIFLAIRRRQQVCFRMMQRRSGPQRCGSQECAGLSAEPQSGPWISDRVLCRFSFLTLRVQAVHHIDLGKIMIT